MQAAHDTTNIPLLMGQIFESFIGQLNVRAEIDVEINACNEEDIEKIERERTKMVRRVTLFTKHSITPTIQIQKPLFGPSVESA